MGSSTHSFLVHIINDCMPLYNWRFAKVYADSTNVNGSNAVIFLIYLFSATYAFSFTPLCVSYPVEIVNYSIRTKGMAFSQIVTFGFG